MFSSAPKAKIVTINNREGLTELSININDRKEKERLQHVLSFKNLIFKYYTDTGVNVKLGMPTLALAFKYFLTETTSMSVLFKIL